MLPTLADIMFWAGEVWNSRSPCPAILFDDSPAGGGTPDILSCLCPPFPAFSPCRAEIDPSPSNLAGSAHPEDIQRQALCPTELEGTVTSIQ